MEKETNDGRVKWAFTVPLTKWYIACVKAKTGSWYKPGTEEETKIGFFRSPSGHRVFIFFPWAFQFGSMEG